MDLMAAQFLGSHFLYPRQLPELLSSGRRIHQTKLATLVQRLDRISSSMSMPGTNVGADAGASAAENDGRIEVDVNSYGYNHDGVTAMTMGPRSPSFV